MRQALADATQGRDPAKLAASDDDQGGIGLSRNLGYPPFGGPVLGLDHKLSAGRCAQGKGFLRSFKN